LLLEAMYQGTEVLLGQAYLDLLSSILNISVRETPVFNKEFFKLLTVREDQVTYRPVDGYYEFELTSTSIKDCMFLQNRVFNPTLVLSRDIEFHLETDTTSVVGGDPADLLVFHDAPFDWAGSGEPPQGIAWRVVDVVAADGTISRQRQISFWIPDAQVDKYDMYLNYGYLVGHFEASSESYRAFLRGVMRYFVLGPTNMYLTSALNVVAGIPVIRENGEILINVDTTDPNGDDTNIITTDRNTYAIPNLLPLRADLTPANYNVLTFSSLEHLSAVFTVYDSISNPTWWYDIQIPERVMPDESGPRREINPSLYENLINNPPGLVHVGDPGFILGADEDGFIPSDHGIATRPPMRHLFSYITFERFLRQHSFAVVLDPDSMTSGVIPYERLGVDLQRVVTVGKSAYTFLYLDPIVFVKDTAPMTDTIELEDTLGVLDEVEAVDGGLTIGVRSWEIGDYYCYTAAGIAVQNESVVPYVPFVAGQTPVVLAGNDPTHNVVPLASGLADGNFSWPLGHPHGTFTISGAPPQEVFHDNDVGKWLYAPSTGIMSQIITVLSTTSVEYTDTNHSILIGVPWSLWDRETSPQSGQTADWAVQIEVMP